MPRPERLSADCLRPSLDPAGLADSATSPRETRNRHDFQPRFVRTLDLAMAIREPGYNVYVAGEPGMGRSFMLRHYLAAMAGTTPPGDLIYTFNFSDPDQPETFSLPPGQGRLLKQDMGQALRNLRKNVPLHFEQESYVRKHDKLMKDLTTTRERLLDQMEEHALKNGFSLSVDDSGALSLFPLVEGKVLTPEEYDRLDADTRKRLKDRTDHIMGSIGDLSRQVNREELNFKEKEQRLERESVRTVLSEILAPVREKYPLPVTLPPFFDALQEDILENLDRFREQDKDNPADAGDIFSLGDHFFHRYEINLFVDNTGMAAPPVILDLFQPARMSGARA